MSCIFFLYRGMWLFFSPWFGIRIFLCLGGLRNFDYLYTVFITSILSYISSKQTTIIQLVNWIWHSRNFMFRAIARTIENNGICKWIKCDAIVKWVLVQNFIASNFCFIVKATFLHTNLHFISTIATRNFVIKHD